MTESKIELTERLRRDGRWSEASRFKDTALRDFRDKGMKRSEASDAAWEAMATAFPPLDTGSETIPFVTPDGHHGGDADDLIDLDDLAGGRPFDFARDVQLVYQHLGADVRPQDAPSAGAWGLLTWARRNPGRFFETILPKAKSADQDEEVEVNPRRFAKKTAAELRAIVAAKLGGGRPSFWGELTRRRATGGKPVGDCSPDRVSRSARGCHARP